MEKKIVNNILSEMDKMASELTKNYSSYGLSKKMAAAVVQNIDSAADTIEKKAFGVESFERRRSQVMQRDTDETYMDTFENPMKPLEVNADEPYMGSFDDDQSSAVMTGKDQAGKPFAPKTASNIWSVPKFHVFVSNDINWALFSVGAKNEKEAKKIMERSGQLTKLESADAREFAREGIDASPRYSVYRIKNTGDLLPDTHLGSCNFVDAGSNESAPSNRYAKDNRPLSY